MWRGEALTRAIRAQERWRKFPSRASRGGGFPRNTDGMITHSSELRALEVFLQSRWNRRIVTIDGKADGLSRRSQLHTMGGAWWLPVRLGGAG